MNILLINHYAGSPELGMEYRPYYLAREWIKLGHNVYILVASHSHIRSVNPAIEKDFREENIDGIKYIWVRTPSYNDNSIKRVQNIFTFVLKVFFRLKYLVQKIRPDLVIASSTYTSDNYLAYKMAKMAHAKYIYEVHDLWPLSPIELGGMSRYHPFIMLMQHGENFAYKNADMVISMLPKTKEHMARHGLDLKKWHYIPNGIVAEDWLRDIPLNEETRGKISKIREHYDTIVGYTGTFGVANALYSLILSAELLKDNNIAIVMIGKGPEKENLKNLIRKKNLNNVFILDPIPKTQIPVFLSQCDILITSFQRQPLFRFGISQNKIFDYLMAAKPIIQAIDAGNSPVEEANAGLYAEPENPQAIVDAIFKLCSMSKPELDKMGKNGKEFVLKHHNYKFLSKQFLKIVS